VASRNKVIMETRFAEWGAAAEAELYKAIDEGSALAVEAAKAAETAKDTGDLRGSIHVVPARPGPRGIEGGIAVGDYKANWFELGTLSRRSKAHKGGSARAAARNERRKAMRSAGDYQGVKARHFMRKGLVATRSQVFERIGKALRDARAL
jgi:hypothetical protein